MQTDTMDKPKSDREQKAAKFKAITLVRHLKARAADPASSPNEVEVCIKKIESLSKEFNLGGYHFRAKTNVMEIKLRMLRPHHVEIAKNIILELPGPIALVSTDEGYVIAAGKKSNIRRFAKFYHEFNVLFLNAYDEAEAEYDANNKGKSLAKFGLNPKEKVMEAWAMGFAQGVSQCFVNLKDFKVSERIQRVDDEETVVTNNEAGASMELVDLSDDAEDIDKDDITTFINETQDKDFEIKKDDPQTEKAKLEAQLDDEEKLLIEEYMRKNQISLTKGFWKATMAMEPNRLLAVELMPNSELPDEL